MKNAEYFSLIFSFVAILMSGLALGWNIYRDVILKARVKVSLQISDLIFPEPSSIPTATYITISATNFGPGKVKIVNTSLVDAPWKKWILATEKLAIVIPDLTNPLNGKIPSWIEVGDRLDLLFPFDRESFLSREWSKVGLFDSFGRSHYAPKEDVVEANRQWKEKFGNQPHS